jgi:subtilisin family serine protease
LKRSASRFALPLVALLPITLIYNSCQGGLLGSKGFSAASSSVNCKPGMENGVAKKMETNNATPPGAFARKKVLLRDDFSENSGLAKTSAPVTVDAGRSLGVILNNSCLQENSDQVAGTLITKAAISTGGLIPGLDRQAYEWILDRDYTDTEIETLADGEPCVEGISWNREYKIQATFNDSGMIYQTHLNSIRAMQSYDSFYNTGGGMNLTGTLSDAVVVAVVDTGVDWRHPDLEANMWAHQNGVGIDITTVGSQAVDYNPFDVSTIGHGTHVAGLVAAVSNNRQGIIGTMPFRARIMAIKIFRRESNGELSTTSQFFYNAVKFAYLNKASVINLSLGAIGPGAAADSLAQAGVSEAIANGSFVTVVIGNADGGGNGQVVDGTTFSSIPGQYSTMDGVIGVGSFDSNTGSKSYFSHYSTTYAEIAGPGAEQGTTGIYSTIPTALSSYGRLAGTSQAAPIVSAAAALTVGMIKEAYGVSPTPAEVERLLKASAVKSPSLTTFFKDGNKLDLLNLVQKINQDYPNTRLGGGTASIINPCN